MCGLCGSPSLHESSRGGLREHLLRLVGATVYRCDHCRRRFAFAVLGRHRHHHRSRSGRDEPKPLGRDHAVTVARRRRIVNVVLTLGAALITFLVASWLIGRAERTRLESDGVVQPPPH